MRGVAVVLLLIVPLSPESSAQRVTMSRGELSKASPQALIDKLERARDKGYRMLLEQLRVAKDAERFGTFFEGGYRECPRYAEHDTLPTAWWVYDAPFWYLWRDRRPFPTDKRSWGPEQVTGKPDTAVQDADAQTAWASKKENRNDEWLLVELDGPVHAFALEIHQSFRPGAIARVTCFDLDGTEHELWRAGREASTDRVLRLEAKDVRTAMRYKLYIDCSKVDGWNEIDAVGVVDAVGATHWSVAAHASTTYASPRKTDVEASIGVPQPDELSLEARVERLEEGLRRLETRLDKLVDLLEKRGK